MISTSQGTALIFDGGERVMVIAPCPLLDEAVDYATELGMRMEYPGGFLPNIASRLCWSMLHCNGIDSMRLEAAGLHCSVPENVLRLE